MLTLQGTWGVSNQNQYSKEDVCKNVCIKEKPSTALLKCIFNIQFCQSNGGHLAELDTAQKDTKINQHLDKNKYYWIGLKRIRTEGRGFVWTKSGKNVTYSLWWMDYNEPGGNGDCVFKDGFREDNIRQSFKGRLKEEL